MDWKTMLTYISGSVDEELLLRNEYLVAEDRVLRNQLQGRLRLTDVKRPGTPVLSPFVFLDTTGNGRNLGQCLAAQSLSLDGEPAPVVVGEPETLAPKPGSEHTVLLLQVVDHILLLAVDPASQNEQ